MSYALSKDADAVAILQTEREREDLKMLNRLNCCKKSKPTSYARLFHKQVLEIEMMQVAPPQPGTPDWIEEQKQTAESKAIDIQPGIPAGEAKRLPLPAAAQAQARPWYSCPCWPK